MATRKPKKKPRSRGYTGPKTADGVWEYLQTDAYQKAKVKAMESLSKEEYLELFERIRKHMLESMALIQERMDAKARARGFKI